jgi:hypothetical protein
VLGGIEAQSDTLTGRIEVEHVFDQDRIAPFETPTADYTLINASLGILSGGLCRRVRGSDAHRGNRRAAAVAVPLPALDRQAAHDVIRLVL